MNKQAYFRKMKGFKGSGIQQSKSESNKFISPMLKGAIENDPASQFPETTTFSIGTTSVNSNAPNIAANKGLDVKDILFELEQINKQKKKVKKAGFK